MNEVTLRNESGAAISDSLRARITLETRGLPERLAREGHDSAEIARSVVILLLPNGNPANRLVVPKADLREFLNGVRLLVCGREEPPIIKESLIQRCLRENPDGCIRVLFISQELCGSIQIHANVEQAKHQEVRRMEKLNSQDAELYQGSYGSVFRPGSVSKDEQVKDRLRSAINEAETYMNKEQRQIAESIHEKIKDLPREEALRVVADAELATSEELAELRAKRLELGESSEAMVRNFIEKLPDFRERWKSVVARSKKAIIPPDAASANNVETTFMSATYVLDPITSNIGMPAEEVAFLVGRFSESDPILTKLLQRMSSGLRGRPFSSTLQDFGVSWMKAGFPKLEIGHKLAASLCLTDVPDDIEVQAPWPAWSLIIPPGLFGEDKDEETYARIWCIGAEPAFFVLSSGEIFGAFTREKFIKWNEEQSKGDKAVMALTYAIDSLIRGACLALSNPDEYKRQSVKDKAASAKKSQRSGEPDFSVSRFMLSAPVQVDVRQHLLDVTSGKKRKTGGGGAPTVQFFVRGHWRNQAHGPRMSLRKQMRIEGYWKGPEHGAIKLGNYKVKDEE